MNQFFDAFDASLEEAENVMGVPWKLGGTQYTAISAEKLTITDRAVPGGRIKDASVVLLVRDAVVSASGVKKGAIIDYDGEQLRVMSVEREGDASQWLICGPAGVEVPRR